MTAASTILESNEWDFDIQSMYRHRSPFDLETSVPGIFAVGDVKSGSVKRVATGVGLGGVAVSYVFQFLREKEEEEMQREKEREEQAKAQAHRDSLI